MTLAALKKKLEELKSRLRTPVAPFTVTDRTVEEFEPIHLVQGRQDPSIEIVWIPVGLFVMPLPFEEVLWIQHHAHLDEVPEPVLHYGLYSAPQPPEEG